MSELKYFENPQDIFLTQEFIETIQKHIKIGLINHIPTIDGKTIFRSTEKYTDINKQNLLITNFNKPNKYFFIKPPISYKKIFKNYHIHFRNQVRKAQKNNLQFRTINNPDQKIIERCYKIYDENMYNLNTFSFNFDFFKDISTLSFSFYIVVEKNNEIISFGLMLGNQLFIQSSTKEGKQLCSNNFLYDIINQIYENKKVFYGIASRNNKGLISFKKKAGLIGIPAMTTYFEIAQYLPSWFRHNKIIGKIIRLIDKKKILKYVLPY